MTAAGAARLPYRSAPPYRTARLILRHATDVDYPAVAGFHGTDEVARWLYWEPRHGEEMRSSFARMKTRTVLAADGDALHFVIEVGESGDVVGDCVLILPSASHEQGEIGYILAPQHHGRGFATEAARELMRIAFDEIGLHRVVGRIEPRNGASARVLDRVGMRHEATLVENEWVKGEWQSEAIYALLRDEWSSTPTA